MLPQINMAKKNIALPNLFSVMSPLFTYIEMNIAIVSVVATHFRRKFGIIQAIESINSNQTIVKRLQLQRRCLRRPRRFWVRPGRSSSWWDNMQLGIAIKDKWKENFRMSRQSL